MFYTERFKEVLISTLAGFGIGAVISFVIALLFQPTETSQLVGLTLAFMLFIGPIVAIILCQLCDVQGFIGSAIGNILSGLKYFMFGGSVFSAVGFIKLFIGMFIFIPVSIFMVISYAFNFVYLGIMCLFEKCNLLHHKEGLCSVLDKLVVISAGVVTAILFVKLLQQI